MNRFYFTLFVVFIGSLVILLAASLQSSAATVSGEVVDEEGDPVSDITVAIKSFKGNVAPDRRHRMHRHESVFPPPQPSNTDAIGAFSIDNIVSHSVNQLTLFPEHNSEYEIRAIEMQGIAFNIHPHQISWHGGFTFGIEEETDIKDVKITVRLRMRIRGRVLAADGAPLSNARVNLNVSSRSIDGSGRGSGGGTETLDIDGGFTRYVNSPAYYIVSVTYQGQSAESQEILLEKGQRLDGLTLTLEVEQQAPKLPNFLRPRTPRQPNGVKLQAPPVPKPRDMRHRQALMKRQAEGVWAVNPANRHAYKLINSKTPEAAIAAATAQGAHLVAINDAAEQQWLLDVYGKENYWIGFTDGLKQGDKKWDNGDPITYTSWDTQKLLSAPKKLSEKDENTSKTFTVLIGVTGKWQQVRADNPVASITERAILEKKDLVIDAPTPDEETE
ncbi:hypothetical protein J4G08_17535 [Candidatus Poribacteria bacterium]|nr:hypothetical protein [Candidatus Poribacteria bacterium]